MVGACMNIHTKYEVSMTIYMGKRANKSTKKSAI